MVLLDDKENKIIPPVGQTTDGKVTQENQVVTTPEIDIPLIPEKGVTKSTTTIGTAPKLISLDTFKSDKVLGGQLSDFQKTGGLQQKDISELKDTGSLSTQVQKNFDAYRSGLTTTPENKETDFTSIESDKIVSSEISDVKTTGIDELDTEINKIRQDKDEEIKTTLENFNIVKGQYERQKGNFTNFDEVNQKAEGVLGALGEIRQGGNEPTDEQIQQIANNYGVSVDEVTDPQSIFGLLETSEEGKKNLGVNKVGETLTDAETALERKKADAELALARFEEDTNTQIANIERQVKENIEWGIASGVWSGGMRSSGYQTGLDNIKKEGERNVSQLKKMLARAKNDDEVNMSRLQADYDTAVSRINADMEEQLKTLKFDTGLQLNGLTDTYGIGSTALTKALDSIQEEFGAKSLQAFNNYVNAYKGVQDIMTTNIETQNKIMNLKDTTINKRYNEYLSNDGSLLRGVNLNTLQQEVNSGKLSKERFSDLKNIMSSSIIGTLGELGTVDTTDIATIGRLLDSGLSMGEVVATMQGKEKFTPKATVEKVIDLGTKKRVIYSDGTQEDIEESGLEYVEDSQGNKIYGEYKDGKFKAVDISSPSMGELDFTSNQELIDKYPTTAAFKNNNPTGLTVGASKELINLWDNAGINYSVGTARKTDEGGNYYKFDTVEDGMKAYEISLTKRGDDINDRLKVWVGSTKLVDGVRVPDEETRQAYATELMNIAGIEQGEKFSELSDEKLANLMTAQLQRESPNYINEIINTQSEMEEEVDTENLLQERKAFGLIQGLGGTEGERSIFLKNVLDTAKDEGTSLEEAKIKLGYKTDDDMEFLKERGSTYKALKKQIDNNTSEARTTLSLLENPATAIGDVATVVGFLKTIDPGSVARESEVEGVERAKGLLDGLSAKFQKLKSGKKLTDEQRNQIKEAITTIVDAADLKIHEEKEQFITEAYDKGLNVDRFIPKNEIDKITRKIKIDRGTATEEEIQKETGITPMGASTAGISAMLGMQGVTGEQQNKLILSEEEQTLIDNFY